jgi:Virulence protein
MGLTSTQLPQKVRKADIEIGKNYLAEDELAGLKLIVEQYLAFAEAQALAHKPMYMRDWIEKLGQVLTLNDKNILDHAGKISHKLALKKADEEYQKFQELQRKAERLESIKELDNDIKKLSKSTKKK